MIDASIVTTRRHNGHGFRVLKGRTALQVCFGFWCVSVPEEYAAMTKDDAQVFSGTTNEDVRLEDLGYEQGIQNCFYCSYVHANFE